MQREMVGRLLAPYVEGVFGAAPRIAISSLGSAVRPPVVACANRDTGISDGGAAIAKETKMLARLSYPLAPVALV